MYQNQNKNALGGRRSSLTDLDAELQAKLMIEHQQQSKQNLAAAADVKLPNFGVEDIDNCQAININFGLLSLKEKENRQKQNSAQLHGNNSSPKKQFAQSEQSSEDSDEDDEHHDLVGDLNAFRQLDYLWLFDNELKFSERPNFQLDDLNVKVDDFHNMRQINRRVLTEFCKRFEDDQEMAEEFENPEMMIEEELKESWADENLDEHIKAIITDYENGSGIEIDIVSHLEYFYNTLDCDFHTKNPFDSPTSYPALLYKEPMQRSQSIGESSNSQQTLQEKTLFEKHRALIFPNSNSVKSKSKSSMSGGGTGKSASSSDISPAGKAFLNVQNQFSTGVDRASNSTNISCMLLPKKYKWYPNQSIVSPKKSVLGFSPSPKCLIANAKPRRSSAAVATNPYQRVSGQYDPEQLLALRMQPVGQAQSFGECVGNYDSAASMAAGQASANSQQMGSVTPPPAKLGAVANKSAAGKGVKQPKMPDASQGPRRMSVLDQPLINDGHFETFTKSAANPSQKQKKSMLAENIHDFEFDDLM